MSGMYNMLMGRNPFFPMLAGLVGIHKDNCRQFGRLRDAWITADAKRINILHRNYGEDGAEADAAAAALPGFVAKHMDPRDDTYGWYEFDVDKIKVLDVPQDKIVLMAEKIAGMSDTANCMDRYHQAIEDFKNDVPGEQTDHMKAAGKQLLDGLQKAFETGKDTAVGDVVIERIK